MAIINCGKLQHNTVNKAMSTTINRMIRSETWSNLHPLLNVRPCTCRGISISIARYLRFPKNSWNLKNNTLEQVSNLLKYFEFKLVLHNVSELSFFKPLRPAERGSRDCRGLGPLPCTHMTLFLRNLNELSGTVSLTINSS